MPGNIINRKVSITRTDDGYLLAHFKALGGPCEILIDAEETIALQSAITAVANETWRIEDKFSRYKNTGIVHQINSANGNPVYLDNESSGLIDYANTCYELSNGLFDITSGILRKVWCFDGNHHLPQPKAIKKMMRWVGWHKVQWHKPFLQLQKGMEIDLGGIGKEYAVDRSAGLLKYLGFNAALVNYGGDLCTTGPQRNGTSWLIGIDNPRDTGNNCLMGHSLNTGALATSGDARRFVLIKNQRYGHILNPHTGWPVQDAPRSVTVQAPSCLEAGMLSTFGILQGCNAETFLQSQNVLHFIVR